VAVADGGDRHRGGEVQLHGHSGKLRAWRGEVEGALTCLPTVTRLQWRTVACCGGGLITEKEEEDVNNVCHNLGQLFEEEGGNGLTGQRQIERRGGCGIVHDWWGKTKMRLARCDSGDEVGWGSTGELARFH
jgi:hypothetical protein